MKLSLKHYSIALLVLSGIVLSLCLSTQLFYIFLGLSIHDINPIHFFQLNAILTDQTQQTKWWIALLLPPAIITILITLSLNQNQRHLFGNAHWASYFEAKKAGLLAKKGILLGKKWGRYLCIGGYEHVLVFAPSGSGKTSCIAIPNLLNWDESIVCQDVKLTLYEKTAKYREKHGQACFIWHPAAPDRKTHCYNPLSTISKDPVLRIDQIQKIAHIFIPDNSKQDPIWTVQPRLLFVAIILYLMDTPERPCTLGEMTRIIKGSQDFSSWINDTVESRTDLDPLCVNNFYSFLQTHHKTQSSILQSFLSHFELWDNPLIDAATSHSDFDLSRLRKDRMTIYLGITSDNLVRLSPLITVFYQQIFDTLLQKIPDKALEPHGVLLLIDEFSALARMEILQKSIGLMREYKLRLMAIIQDLAQLYTTYGRDGATAFINTKIRIAFRQNDLESAKLLSEWLGDQTILHCSQSRDNWSIKGESRPPMRRRLMLPNEIMCLKPEKAIIVMEGNSPILADKIQYQKIA